MQSKRTLSYSNGCQEQRSNSVMLHIDVTILQDLESSALASYGTSTVTDLWKYLFFHYAYFLYHYTDVNDASIS